MGGRKFDFDEGKFCEEYEEMNEIKKETKNDKGRFHANPCDM
jgi:hypothetical protein